jgi:hypothetical protein
VTGKGIFAGGIFFVAKEYPSRTLPKKAILDFLVFNKII